MREESKPVPETESKLSPMQEAIERAKAKTGAIAKAAEIALPESLDWKKWSLPVTAELLRRVPQADGSFLTSEQAAIWAIECYDLGVSPFRGDTWYNPKANRVNLTLQGKLKVARANGLNLGAPKFERLPADAEVLIISRGDDHLVNLGGRRVAHFPQADDGGYAGHHPADSGEAIAHLEELRGRGAQYLIVPATSDWWLEYYAELTAHLEHAYTRVEGTGEHLVAFALSGSPAAAPVP